LKQGHNPPDLIVDLDGAVVLRFDRNVLRLGVGKRKPFAVVANDTRDLLGRNGRFALRVYIIQHFRTRKSEIGLGHDYRLTVLTGNDLVEPFLAGGGIGIEDTVLFVAHLRPPLKILPFVHTFTSL